MVKEEMKHPLYYGDLEVEPITILMVNKNGPLLLNTLSNIVTNTKYPYKILIANAGDKLNITDYMGKEIKVIECNSGTIAGDYKQAFPHVDTKHVVLLGSDFLVQPNWLTYAVEDYKTNFGDGYGILALNDGIQDGKIACVILTSMNTINELFKGELLDTRFMHYYNDTLLTAIAKHKGIYAYSERSLVLHQWERDVAEETRCWEHDRILYDKEIQNIKDGKYD